jgi:hypothetical protein
LNALTKDSDVARIAAKSPLASFVDSFAAGLSLGNLAGGSWARPEDTISTQPHKAAQK